MRTKRASARRLRAPKIDPQQRNIDAVENAVASASVSSLVTALRAAAFDDGFIAASLLAGATSLIRGMPDKSPWVGLFEQMAAEVRGER
ncbi:hypothetical protein [Mesorhizobium sp. CO1-1-9]|uniref:hypothetical protein n=1 Tax=Mesorhizobium sp. CO1-1-9 TaxID=2876630 RepID=UPI001CCDC905|nr:hypothetical protein [Mesorhizobium sp. CO1-1-9]MBZ9698823.1 hypothetical protein [Mesorhizobium sp. CO1-1-9]